MAQRKWSIEPEKAKEFVDKVREAARKNKERQAAQKSRNNKN